MHLPKIEVPIHTTELPSTGQTIKFRPFLVKEEKVLLMAMESEDEKQITVADLTGVAVQDIQIATAVFKTFLENKNEI